MNTTTLKLTSTAKLTSTVKLTPEAGDAALANAWWEEASETGEDDTYTRRHRDPRTTWNARLEIHVTSRGRRVTLNATACDISRGGIGFTIRQALPTCSHIQICRAGEMVGMAALTRDCTRSLTGYTIGAEFRFKEAAPTRVRLAKAG